MHTIMSYVSANLVQTQKEKLLHSEGHYLSSEVKSGSSSRLFLSRIGGCYFLFFWQFVALLFWAAKNNPASPLLYTFKLFCLKNVAQLICIVREVSYYSVPVVLHSPPAVFLLSA